MLHASSLKQAIKKTEYRKAPGLPLSTAVIALSHLRTDTSPSASMVTSSCEVLMLLTPQVSFAKSPTVGCIMRRVTSLCWPQGRATAPLYVLRNAHSLVALLGASCAIPLPQATMDTRTIRRTKRRQCLEHWHSCTRSSTIKQDDTRDDPATSL